MQEINCRLLPYRFKQAFLALSAAINWLCSVFGSSKDIHTHTQEVPLPHQYLQGTCDKGRKALGVRKQKQDKKGKVRANQSAHISRGEGTAGRKQSGLIHFPSKLTFPSIHSSQAFKVFFIQAQSPKSCQA